MPNVGKSTLFNAVTRTRNAEAANYPFCTIDPNVGVVNVPDPRIEPLAQLSKSKKVVPAAIEFVDIAGLVEGAAEGAGLGNQFLANIREVAAIAHVVRCFEDDDVVHVEGRVDPVADIETIDTELLLADLATLDRRRDRLVRAAKGDPEAAGVLAAVDRLRAALEQGTPARASGATLPPDVQLLTAKPVIYVCNVEEGSLASGNAYVARVRERAARDGAEVVVVSARIEQELAELDEDEAQEFLRELGATRSGLERLIETGYRTLGLSTFFTASEKEVRAWTIPSGATAPEAAGEIHTDMQRGFIRAETIAWDVLVDIGSLAAARAKGLLRTEGKAYRVQDGDVVHFLFNV
jgi:GTP-binding protein YchF